MTSSAMSTPRIQTSEPQATEVECVHLTDVPLGQPQINHSIILKVYKIILNLKHMQE